MNERITSPEELNKRLKVSKAGVWAVLVLLLLIMTAWLLWLFKSEVSITEDYSCLVAGDERTLSDYIYDIILLESRDPETAKDVADGVISGYGEEFSGRHLQTVCIFVDEAEKTELEALMLISVNGHEGIIIDVPSDSFDYREFLYGSKALGFLPGKHIRGSQSTFAVMAGLYTDGIVPLSPGLYRTQVVKEVIRPSELILY